MRTLDDGVLVANRLTLGLLGAHDPGLSGGDLLGVSLVKDPICTWTVAGSRLSCATPPTALPDHLMVVPADEGAK